MIIGKFEIILNIFDYIISLLLDNWRIKWYDKFQYHVQGILP